MYRPSTIERAYALAETGEFETLVELKARLNAEGCTNVETALRSRHIQGHLRAICAAAHGRAALLRAADAVIAAPKVAA
jgi:hypothetical protein